MNLSIIAGFVALTCAVPAVMVGIIAASTGKLLTALNISTHQTDNKQHNRCHATVLPKVSLNKELKCLHS
jgi:hypothetical protein